MKTYNFDAFGNPVERPVNGKPRPTEFHSDGVYDPALAMYYQPVQPHPQSVGLFTNLENHQVPIQNPASLHKYLYAEANPVNGNDPTGMFLLDTLAVATDEGSEVAEEGPIAAESDELGANIVGDLEQDQAADELLEAADDAGPDSAEANELTEDGLNQEESTADEAENGEDDEEDDNNGGSELLLHGTTALWAASILLGGPDAGFLDPANNKPVEGISFATPLANPPASFYARATAAHYPGQGGPAVLCVQVPLDIIEKTVDGPPSDLDPNEIRFLPGAGLEDLQAEWPSLTKFVVPV